MGKTIPNEALARAMVDAGMSNNGLARRVKTLAEAAGGTSSADHVAVKRWLDGTQPKPETARFIAASLTEKLRRAVTPASLGFTAALPDEPATQLALAPIEYAGDADTATNALRAHSEITPARSGVSGPRRTRW